MQIKDQVCTYEQALKLRQLGILQNQSQFVFCAESENDEWDIAWRESGYAWSDHPGYEGYPFMIDTYTVAELGVMMPYIFKYQELNCFISSTKFEPADDKAVKWICGIHTVAADGPVIAKKYFTSQTEAEGRAKLLIHLLEKEIIIVSEVNERLSL